MIVGGIFVGGASSRMSKPKGLLSAGGETLIARLARVLREVGVEPMLVGVRPEYAAIDLPAIADAAPRSGPLAGLVALLERAPRVLAIACDMPHVDAALLRRLLDAPDAPIVAPKRGDFWEPLCARYDAAVLGMARDRLARGELSLQRLLDEAGAHMLPLDATDLTKLGDWDTPTDMGSV